MPINKEDFINIVLDSLRTWKESNYKIAKETGLSEASLSNWKSGKARPSLGNAQLLAGYFNCTYDFNEKSLVRVMGNDEFVESAIDFLKTSKISNYKIPEATGLSQSAIGTWKRGDKKPTFANAQTIIGYFKGNDKFNIPEIEEAISKKEFIDLALDAIKDAKYTSYEIAKATGLSQASFSQWKSGDKRPSFRSAQAIIGFLNGTDKFKMSKTEEAKIISDDVIMIPVLNLDTRGGLLPNDQCDVPEFVTEMMPFSPSIAQRGDIVVPVFGDSMAPKYSSGSLVLIRNVELWREYIELGSTYVIELVDGRRMIKNIIEGADPDTLTLVSINPAFPPSTISRSIIKNIFRVIISNRRDSM